ncbi:MAG: DUF2934 domain-containing protein [Candidatus Korobacteraceae bacterium]|jgi:DUF2934 family protein
MPKAPRENDSATPKKRARKTTPKAGNGAHADNGNGALTQSVTVSPKVAKETQGSSSMEEQIRRRAYELYLQRGGKGGSPEQDWLRAQEEISGRASGA